MAKNDGGDNGGGKGKGKKKRNRRLRNQALQDVQFAFQPTLQGIESVYGAYPGEIKNYMQGYTGRMENIAGNLTDQLAGFTDLLGSSGPAGELAAAGGLFGQLGAGGLERLADNAARNQSYMASTLTEGELAARSAMDNLYQMIPAAVLQRVDELRQQALQNRMTLAQIKGERAFADFLKQQTEGLLTPPPGPGPDGTGTPTEQHSVADQSDEMPNKPDYGPPTGVPPYARGETDAKPRRVFNMPWAQELMSPPPMASRRDIIQSAPDQWQKWLRDHWKQYKRRSGWQRPATGQVEPTSPWSPGGWEYPDTWGWG